ncbi:MAG: ribbon-helix-helix domain-containing protein [Actinomycetia bacterium]|nr:ribbon-helix-helix domain-containing protein [Actinomycetes bacterium]
MRVHIELDDDLLAKIDDLAGHRGRSAFVRSAVERAVAQEVRWANLESAAGALRDGQHDWDADPAAWVRAQRHADERRAG